MPIEYSYLTASVLLFGVMIVVQAVSGVLHHGLVPLAGPRDDLDIDNDFSARAKRANQNMIEALVMFAPLVVVAVESGRINETTEFAAGLFLGARLLYAPVYWLGIPWLRTLVWTAGLVAIVLMFLQVLPFAGGT
ncbi:MAG: MAPEG family protein [Pseudomonadota bacterium]